MSAETILTYFVLILCILLGIALSIVTFYVLVQVARLLNRKLSNNWIHNNEHDLWTKIEPEQEPMEETNEEQS